MMHPRTIIRNALAKHLIDGNAAYSNRVFISRAAKLDGLNDLPCVCIYTNSETTESDTNNQHGILTQKLEIEVVVYARRAPDMQQYPLASFEQQPIQYATLAEDLDTICGEVEAKLFEFVSNQAVTYNNETVCLEDSLDLSTKIDQSDGGDVPYSIATISGFVMYKRDLRKEYTYCDLTNIKLDIKPNECILQTN